MGRAKGGTNRASTDPPRGRRPRRTRPQITVPDLVRDLIERRLEELPLDRDALKLGMGQFGDDFDPSTSSTLAGLELQRFAAGMLSGRCADPASAYGIDRICRWGLDGWR